MTQVYVLQLTEGKYYVGSTSDFDRRLAEHRSGEGSAWTKKYPVVNVLSCEEGDALMEDATTKRCMLEHGIENVRGSLYCQIELPSHTISKLKKELAQLDGACFNCGKKGHYAAQCGDSDTILCSRTDMLCTRCGRNNHTVNKCYAKTHFIGGKPIVDAEDIPPPSVVEEDQSNVSLTTPGKCHRCGSDKHFELICANTNDIYGNPLGGGIIRKTWISFINSITE